MSEYDDLNNITNEENTETPEAEEEKEIPETQEEILAKLRLKNKILLAQKDFAQHLLAYNYKIEQLDTLSKVELENLSNEIITTIQCRGSTKLTGIVYFEVAKTVEVLGTRIGMKLKGLHKALEENKSITDVLNELSLKYDNISCVAPELRLAFLTFSAIFTINKLNSTQNTIDDYLNEQVNQNLVEAYADL